MLVRCFQNVARKTGRIDAATLPHMRELSSIIDPSKMIIKRTDSPKPRVPKEKLVFGKVFTDHMLEIDWDSQSGWHAPQISAYHYFAISPAASALHYSLQCFEGMKAYKDAQGNIRLFRPDCNMQRLNSSMKRLYMPPFNGDGFIECIKMLLKVDEDWFPEGDGYSVYLRPTAISTYPFLGVGATEEVKLYVIMCPVGPYYPEGFKPVKLLADTNHVRAWPGGVGNAKLGGNYGPTIAPQMAAQRQGCQQILWLFGEEHRVTEVGAMNILFFWVNEDGERELITAPLDTGDILPGVTRRSILELAREWNEFKVTERSVTMAELVRASQEGRLLEAFGAGTAAVIAPVRGIVYKGQEIVLPTGDRAGPIAQKFWDTLVAIHYGRIPSKWSWVV